MPRQVTKQDLMRTLDPAAAETRIAYSWRTKPWTPGYRCRAEAEAAAGLYGFNYPGKVGISDVNERIIGAGAAAAASPFTYTTTLTLPQTADITAAEDYLDAVLIGYPLPWEQNDGSGIIFDRIETGGSFPAVGAITRPTFQITGANQITVAWGNDGGTNYVDIAKGYIMELIVPDSGAGAKIPVTELKEFAAAGQDVVDVTDFICADTATVNLDRIFC